MTSYLQKLINDEINNTKLAAELIRSSATKKAKRDANRNLINCDVPLENQITELMRTLPNAQKLRPWSMEEFAALLRGKFQQRPAYWKVATALRKLGWAYQRLWGEYGGRRFWIHPDATQV